MLVGPAFSPAVGKVYDENKLDDDEEKGSDHPEIHPSWAEVAVRYEECSDPADNDDEVFESPETFNSENEVLRLIQTLLPFCSPARGSRELFTPIIIRAMNRKKRVTMKQIL